MIDVGSEDNRLREREEKTQEKELYLRMAKALSEQKLLKRTFFMDSAPGVCLGEAFVFFPWEFA